jgi:hypothetical protein
VKVMSSHVVITFIKALLTAVVKEAGRDLSIANCDNPYFPRPALTQINVAAHMKLLLSAFCRSPFRIPGQPVLNFYGGK